MTSPGDAADRTAARTDGVRAEPSASGWADLAGLGAGSGALGGLALAALQLGAAARADLTWIVSSPLGMLLGYPLAGGLAGALAALALECLRRAALPRLDARALVLGVLAVAPAGLRALASAGLRARDVPGGRATALLVVAALVLLLAGMLVWAFSRRGSAGRAPVSSGAACALGFAALTTVLLVHLDLLAGREAARFSGLVGWAALGLLAGALLLGVSVGLALASTRRAARVTAAALLAGGLLVGLGAHGTPVAEARPIAVPDAPNVLLVVLDTLRRDAVSAYGEVADSTPRLDALARRGVLWDDALAPGNWTIPSHASLFTGAQVTRHGAGHVRRRLRLQPGGPDTPPLPTLAELLAWRGFRTAAFVSNMNVSAANGFARGFHEFHETWRGLQGDYDVLAPAAHAWLGVGVRDKGGQATARGVERWLERHADDARPWLLFVNMMEPHAPYHHVPAEHARRFLREDEPDELSRALLADPLAHTWEAGVEERQAEQLWRAYLGAVSYQDELLGRVLDALQRSGAADETLVLVTSDHGEHFGSLGLLGHGQDLGDELLRVPLVAAGPGLPSARVDTGPVSLLDLLPSLLAWTGGDALPPDPGRTGLVLDPGASVAAERARIAERYAHFRTSPDEFHRAVGGGDARWAAGRASLVLGAQRVEVLDGEAGAPPPELRALVERLVRERASWPLALDDAQAAELDDATREQLRALGYVGG